MINISKPMKLALLCSCFLLTTAAYGQEKPKIPPQPQDTIPPLQQGKPHNLLTGRAPEIKTATEYPRQAAGKEPSTTLLLPSGIQRQEKAPFKIKLPYEKD